jgi:hypothetical protein
MFFKLRILGSSNRLFIPYHKGRKWGRIFILDNAGLSSLSGLSGFSGLFGFYRLFGLLSLNRASIMSMVFQKVFIG